MKAENVLIIAYYFPPMGTIGTVRNYNIARQFKRHSNQVYVLSQKKPALPMQDQLATGFVERIAVPCFDYRTTSTLFNRKGKAINNKLNASKKQGAVGFVRKFLESFPTLLFLGEGGLLYILIGFWKAFLGLRKKKVDVIYSSFRPYADHIIAYLIKRIRPTTFWIADFRDLHVDVNRDNVFFRSFQHWCNRKILSRADVVTTVSEGLAKHLKQYNPNIQVLRNGISPLFQERDNKAFDKFTIAYTGSMYTLQTPEPLLKAINNLIEKLQIERKQIQLIYAGKDQLIWDDYIRQFDLEDIYVCKGLVSMQEAASIQRTSHLNLLLSWSSPELSGTLTGKLYDYLAAENAILLLINGTKDEEFEQLFSTLNAGKVAYNTTADLPTIENYILALYQEWQQTGAVKKRMNQEALKAYRWDESFEMFWQSLSI